MCFVVLSCFRFSLCRPEYVKYRGQSLVPLTEKDVVSDTPHTVDHSTCAHKMNNRKSKSADRQEGGSLGESMEYDSFSTDVGSLDYDDFSSSGGADSLGYDNFSSVAGSLEYDAFSSGDEECCDEMEDRERAGTGAGGNCEGVEMGILCGDGGDSHNNLSAAYDMFDEGYGAFSDIIYEDVMKKNPNCDSTSDTTAETQPHSPEDERDDELNAPIGSPIESNDPSSLNKLLRLPKPLSSGILEKLPVRYVSSRDTFLSRTVSYEVLCCDVVLCCYILLSLCRPLVVSCRVAL